MFSLSAIIAASLARDSMSAPVYPSVSLDSLSRSTDLSSGIFSVWIFRICNRPSSSGTGTYTILSNLPGLRIAGSRMSGRFVAPMIRMSEELLSPSISVRS